MNSTNQDATKTAQRRMQKRVEKKDDGRLLIYYTFESEPTKAPPPEKTDRMVHQ